MRLQPSKAVVIFLGKHRPSLHLQIMTTIRMASVWEKSEKGKSSAILFLLYLCVEVEIFLIVRFCWIGRRKERLPGAISIHRCRQYPKINVRGQIIPGIFLPEIPHLDLQLFLRGAHSVESRNYQGRAATFCHEENEGTEPFSLFSLRAFVKLRAFVASCGPQSSALAVTESQNI